jgi:phage baseplate assembly protein W
MVRSLDETKAFLGIGWAFAVCLDKDAAISTVAYEEDIQQAIRIILGTNHGERVMRPEFGAGLNTFVFEPVSPTTMQLVKQRVEEALIDWEPRIDVLQVKVGSDTSEYNKLLIDVEYHVRATNTLANLVYPFYLQEGAPK